MLCVHVVLKGYFNYCLVEKRSLALPLPPHPTPSTCSPHLIHQYSNMAPRLSGQTTIFSGFFFVHVSLLGIESQKKLNKVTICPDSLGAMLEY